MLTDMQNRYKDTVFYVTENGWSQLKEEGLIDDKRVTYYRAALNDVLDSIEAGVKIKGYMAWSLMDNMEWLEGYK